MGNRHVYFTARRSQPLRATRLMVTLLVLGGMVSCAPVTNLRERWASRHQTAPVATWRETPPAVQPLPAPVSPPPRPLRIPSESWEVVGQSEQGQPIEVARIGHGALRLMVIGTVHGDEPEGVALGERLATELWTQPELAAGASVLLVRNANPDGTAGRTRSNAHGVDLNRNFPAQNWKALPASPRGSSGTAPSTESETQLLIELIREFRPDRIIAIHSTRGKPMVNYDGPGRNLADAMAQFNHYAVTDTIGYPTPGSLGSYAGIDLQIPIVTLELPRGIAAETAWRHNRDALLRALR